MQKNLYDILIIGSGAAGFMAAIMAARTAKSNADTSSGQRPLRILLVDGSEKPGTKILIAGGGRCNVTHFEVKPEDYSGATQPSVRKILGRFGVADTVKFFSELGVELKREETGKLFPVTDKAKTILEALVSATKGAGVEIRFPWRVESLEKTEKGFTARSEQGGSIESRLVILATGGKSLPKTGSDGGGYALAQSFGHTLTPQLLPALVPLVVEDGHFIRSLSGLTVPTVLEIRSSTGKKLHRTSGSTLLTHFGLSGPPVLDISRHWLTSRQEDPKATFHISWWPESGIETLDQELIAIGKTSLLGFLRSRIPERLASALCAASEAETTLTGDRLSKALRKNLVKNLTEMSLPITGTKGFALAEVTAGGLPLAEFQLKTLESRVCAGLYACGEILDVDGRIGGFNFQWSWASGFVAGSEAARSLAIPSASE
jgi:predicted Rossmann fold flavoprotein